jgi:hypothetical protein
MWKIKAVKWINMFHNEIILINIPIMLKSIVLDYIPKFIVKPMVDGFLTPWINTDIRFPPWKN